MEKEKKILTYVDFLDDPDFIVWKLTEDTSLKQYWEEYIENNPELYPEFQKAIRILGSMKAKGDKLEKAECDQLLASIQHSVRDILYRKRLRVLRICSAAACLLLIAGFSLFYEIIRSQVDLQNDSLIVGRQETCKDVVLHTSEGTSSFKNNLNILVNPQGNLIVNDEKEQCLKLANTSKQPNRLIVPYGKRSYVTLSDGTKIWVNSGTELEFPVEFKGDSREINVNGEIYIEVAKDLHKPFIVHSSNMDVRVYGTKFNISTYPDIPQSVVLAEGSVGATFGNHREIRMIPGERLMYKDNEIRKEQVDVSCYISWKDGYFLFKDMPMLDILKQVERYYNITFDIENADKLRETMCTGKIYLSQDVNNVMYTISILSSMHYRQEENKIYLDMK